MPSLLDYLERNIPNENDKNINIEQNNRTVKQQKSSPIITDRNIVLSHLTKTNNNQSHDLPTIIESNSEDDPNNDQTYILNDQIYEIEQLTNKTSGILSQSKMEITYMREQLSYIREECERLTVSSYITDYKHKQESKSLTDYTIELENKLTADRKELEYRLDARDKMCKCTHLYTYLYTDHAYILSYILMCLYDTYIIIYTLVYCTLTILY